MKRRGYAIAILLALIVTTLTGGSVGATQQETLPDGYVPFNWSVQNYTCNGSGGYTEIVVYAGSESLTISVTGTDENGNEIVSSARVHPNDSYGPSTLQSFSYADDGNAHAVAVVDDGISLGNEVLIDLDSYDLCNYEASGPEIVAATLTRSDTIPDAFVVDIDVDGKYTDIEYQLNARNDNPGGTGFNDVLTWDIATADDCDIWVNITVWDGDITTFGSTDLVPFEDCFADFIPGPYPPPVLEELPMSLELNDNNTVTANIESDVQLGPIDYALFGSTVPIAGTGTADLISNFELDPCTIAVSADGEGFFAWSSLELNDCPFRRGAGGGPSLEVSTS